MSDRGSGAPPPRVVAVLGPTNTGKTHLAVERMLGHGSGMIGLPLRLLAREIYDRIVKLRGRSLVALITGEEKIVPPRACFIVCTVEAMPLGREVDFLAVDEIQLCADPARGHVFTHRLLHARGRQETMFLGSAAAGGLIRRLLPEAEILSRERFSTLSYAGSKKLTRLPRRTAVVAFSAEQVYAVAELIRRQRGGAAVVMGSLSPRTRNAQVGLFQSGEVDFLVATDAIGMGLNMDVDHVAFAGLRKFDGKRTRFLSPAEVAQIAGRAGRFRRDGTFGVTGECAEMDEDLVRSVEEHRFQPAAAAEWRNAALDFSSVAALQRSLARPPGRDGLKLAEAALDEITLKALAADEAILAEARERRRIERLWEVCQTPDFRKTTLEEHLKLVREIYGHLAGRGLSSGRLPQDWIAGQFQTLDHVAGEIEVLAQRLAGVRTLAYIANRPDWLRDPAEWQGRARLLEDRLSDTLHEKLMQRFIDRRTSVLMRSLNASAELLAGVADDGAVTVEGQFVGRLSGAVFLPAEGETALAEKALRTAARRAVGPEVARRLGALASSSDEDFSVAEDGVIFWRGEAAGRITGGAPFSPVVRLLGDLGPEPARGRARARLETFVVVQARLRLSPLFRLKEAIDAGLKGLARGVAYRLLEAGGVLDRRASAADLALLSQGERRGLRALGVRFSAFAIYCPALLTPDARRFYAAFADLDAPGWRPPADRLSRAPRPLPSDRALSAYGLVVCGQVLAPVGLLERLDQAMRAAPSSAGGGVLTPEALADLGWSEAEAALVLRALGFAPARRSQTGEPSIWRMRRPPRAARSSPSMNGASPFAALAALAPAPVEEKSGAAPADRAASDAPQGAPQRRPGQARRRRRRRAAARA